MSKSAISKRNNSLESIRAWIVRSLVRGGWAPTLVFLLFVILVKYFDVYNQFPEYDIPVHFLGGVAIAYFFHIVSIEGSAHKVLGRFHRVTHCILVLSLTCTAALFWEFAEFLYDYWFGGSIQAGDLNDTLLDMLLGFVGGVVFLITLCACRRLPPSDEEGS